MRQRQRIENKADDSLLERNEIWPNGNKKNDDPIY
jgi:hypothetical protein